VVERESVAFGLRVRRIVALAIVSLALHAIVLSMLPRTAPDAGRVSATAGAIELEVVAGRPVAQATIAEEVTAMRSPSAEPAPRPRSRAPQPHQQGDAVPSDAPTQAAESMALPQASAPGAPSAGLDLSPLAAARTVPLALRDPGQSASDSLDRDRGAALSAELRAAGSAEADALRTQRKLELQRDPDGTCHYEGSAFNATIHPDGGVELADRGPRVEPQGAIEPPEKPVTIEDTQGEQRIEASIKISGRAWDSERAWFMRETQRLRDELSDAALARELAQKEIGLRRELDRIWCEESRPKAQRRRAIFELWTEMSPDEVGARGLRTILEYVQRNLPAGSADAYTRPELTELNLARGQGDRFDPYGDVSHPDVD
jgi:hypothetical protein